MNAEFVVVVISLVQLACSNEQAYEWLHPAHVREVEEPVSCNEYGSIMGVCIAQTKSVCENREEYFK